MHAVNLARHILDAILLLRWPLQRLIVEKMKTFGATLYCRPFPVLV
jgi:hypothetical protein